MNPEDKYPEIAKGLLEKTRQRKAVWDEGPESSFILNLKNSAIRVKLISPPTEVDSITLAFLNKAGREVDTWTVQDGDLHWDLAKDLYRQIAKNVAGWDKVLEDIEAFLKSG
jgi:hypothetical protein